MLERLCAQERKSPRWDTVTVHVVDPGPPGSGRVWRPTQSRQLLMNTVASQVTVYTDASVRIDGPLEEGPSLYEWARALESGTLEGAPDAGAYSARRFLPRRASWAPTRIPPAPSTAPISPGRSGGSSRTPPPMSGCAPTRCVPSRSRMPTVSGRAARAWCWRTAPGWAACRRWSWRRGTSRCGPPAPSAGWRAFAARHGLTYVAPANPADVDLSAVRPGESVLLRGLGLNFFDHMALFTRGRGGVFTRTGGRLVYRPSGREPRLYAGSRRGVPYQARGENEKGAHGRHRPRLLTAEYVAALRAADRRSTAVDFAADLWPLISKEVCAVYYAALLARRGEPAAAAEEFTERYLHAEPGEAEDRLLEEAGITGAQRWDWERIARPYGTRAFPDLAAFRTWLRGHLDEDVRLARQGNVSGPVKAALDVLRDLRNEVRLAVDHAYLSAASPTVTTWSAGTPRSTPISPSARFYLPHRGDGRAHRRLRFWR